MKRYSHENFGGEGVQNCEEIEALLVICMDHICELHWWVEIGGEFGLEAMRLHSLRVHLHSLPCCLYYMVLVVYSPAEHKGQGD